ncbi:HalOD1 output domain-containing protein [Halorussus salinus]|uniref:HalOD1 output domain-containing protein n=1 Tax=Halorussus salinus TaxID=1364935 RepID=UPI00138F412E|nr:HalOD1 output domain-containing protein [Halorussus salinus]
MSEKQSSVSSKPSFTYELHTDQTPSEGVVAAVSTASGIDPATMEPLAGTIDPDAVDAMFADHYDGTPRGTGHVQFAYAGYEVVVSSDGLVSLLEDE